MISESAPTLFSLTKSESTGAMWADEFTCHLWRRFRWWFLSRQRLSFPWLFLSRQCCGCWGRHASHVVAVSLIISEAAKDLFSLTISESTRGGCATESSRHLWQWFRWWFSESAPTLFSLMISKSAPTLFSLANSESLGVVGADESIGHLSKQFRWWFLSRQQLSFPWIFWVDRGCEVWQIHASPLEGFSVMISESEATLFSMTISKSTGAMFADESTCHLRKRFPWWFLSRQRLSFPWLFLSH